MRAVIAFCACGTLVVAGTLLKPAHIRPSENGERYQAFAQLLTPEQMQIHALSRLTFGMRPGDLNGLQAMGIQAWIEQQLHPETIPENQELQTKLQPLASLNMTPREAMLSYPPPQMIAAVARGTGKLPDDPELRAVVLSLADRYLRRRNTVDATPQDDDGDAAGRVPLTEIVSAADIHTLREGKPDQIRAVLAAVPVQSRMQFVWALKAAERRKLLPLAPASLRRDMLLTLNPQRIVADDLSEAKLFRAIYSDRQLEELLVDFWFNHFNVVIDKGADRYLVLSYERDAIRPHVLGKFYDLLLATAKSPAMLFYLDNWQSVAPNLPERGKQKRGLNENYGRELLELHTLGVEGGYTQKDVVEVARCFTGWTIAAPRKGGGFEYNDRVHDKGKKVVLGHTIKAGGGMNDGLEVLKILAHAPATAHFISLCLAKRFVADDPPPSLVNRMAKTFRQKDGDLREVMLTMLRSPEFWSQGAFHAKVKQPLEMVASAVRATGANVDSAEALQNELQKLGEPLYHKVEPTGYTSANVEWVSSAALLERMNFSIALAANRIPGISIDAARWQNTAVNPAEMAAQILGEEPQPATLAAITTALQNPNVLNRGSNAVELGLILGSPDFQRR